MEVKQINKMEEALIAIIIPEEETLVEVTTTIKTTKIQTPKLLPSWQ